MSLVRIALLALLGWLAVGMAQAQEAPPEQEIPTAPVIVDGEVLFRVRGVSAYPAERRAAEIARAIVEVAEDRTILPEAIRAEPMDVGIRIVAGKRTVARVVPADAALEQVHVDVLAEAEVARIREAVIAYRHDRSTTNLAGAGGIAAGATIAYAIAMFVVLRGGGRLIRRTKRRLEVRIRSMEAKSFRLLRATTISMIVDALLRLTRIAIAAILTYGYLALVLRQFPKTRPLADSALATVLGPVGDLGLAFVNQIPDLIALAVIILITRYALELMRLFFELIERREINLGTFEPEWAMPTYKVIRLLVVAFASVVAYPYIPGSHSAAFQGVSIFIGLILSLGSSSVIANIIAGYMMIYRRAFRVGDRIKVGNTIGDVVDIRLLVTHLRSLKNEAITIPNTVILNSEVLNYSALAKSDGLILHMSVGIGYEVPWRQVEAMLLMAAGRVAGLLHSPPPFVLQTSLGDFAVNYELNVYCDQPLAMLPLQAELQRHVLDVFNEYGVQIMTPHYQLDPAGLKIVAPDQWHAAPAPPVGAALTPSPVSRDA
ncbi:MAG: mechanosensitive ion channel [Alphaproteobacteria bacterium]|nr:mechanosensitive ion channel [Alphaproteobacteria bacterium]